MHLGNSALMVHAARPDVLVRYQVDTLEIQWTLSYAYSQIFH